MNKKKMEGLREEQKTKKRSLEASGSLGFGLLGTAPSAESPISPSLSLSLSLCVCLLPSLSQSAKPIFSFSSFAFLGPSVLTDSGLTSLLLFHRNGLVPISPKPYSHVHVYLAHVIMLFTPLNCLSFFFVLSL